MLIIDDYSSTLSWEETQNERLSVDRRQLRSRQGPLAVREDAKQGQMRRENASRRKRPIVDFTNGYGARGSEPIRDLCREIIERNMLDNYVLASRSTFPALFSSYHHAQFRGPRADIRGDETVTAPRPREWKVVDRSQNDERDARAPAFHSPSALNAIQTVSSFYSFPVPLALPRSIPSNRRSTRESPIAHDELAAL